MQVKCCVSYGYRKIGQFWAKLLGKIGDDFGHFAYLFACGFSWPQEGLKRVLGRLLKAYVESNRGSKIDPNGRQKQNSIEHVIEIVLKKRAVSTANQHGMVRFWGGLGKPPGGFGRHMSSQLGVQKSMPTGVKTK